MLQEFVHCRKCVDCLSRYGNIPLDIYLGICELYCQDHDIFCDYGNTMINFLESKGFIVTTECYDDSLAIKPNGYVERETECGYTTHEFCAFRHIH